MRPAAEPEHWALVCRQARLEADDPPPGDNFPMALLGWTAGCAVIWSGLFMVGNFLYGRTAYGCAVAIVFILSATLLLWVIRHLWSGRAHQRG